MTPQKWRIAAEIFGSVWESPREERGRTLERLCGGDPELQSEVLSLLAAHESADNWQPPPEPDRAPEPEARQFGSYRLERMIARGGMGAVYLGHRADGNFEQKVAIKIIGLPFELEPFRERFRQERQILASLNHPHITHLIDGGVTPGGELYLIMEYVDGVAIDEYVRSKALTQSETLDLFRQVAGAVLYAHQNLVVHRDLKPANILVSAEGVPKLLDFGTAKLLNDERFDNATSGGVLTIAYASPEQLRGQTATTLSDIYSLGVVLYELLRGEKAFTGGLASRVDPGTELRQLAPLQGELDLIVRKAMSPDPADRYASVEQFIEDIRRYQSGDPVLAHPASATYRLRKFLRRHRLPAAAALFASCAVLGGAVATLWQARRATLAREVAEARFQDVRQLGRYLVFDIHGGLESLPGSTALRKQVVAKALEFMDALAQDPAAGNTLRLEVAEGYEKLADVLGNPNRPSLGERAKALETYDKALLSLTPVLATEPQNLKARRLAAQIRVQQAGTRDFGGKPHEGLEQMAHAVADLKALAKEAPNDLPTLLALAGGLELEAKRTSAGGGVTENSDAAHVESFYNEAEQTLQGALKAYPGRPEIIQHLAQISYGRALLWGSSNPNRAIQHHQETAAWLHRLPPKEAGSLEVRRLSAGNLLNLGWAQGQTKAYAEAIANITQAGEVLSAWAAMDPANTTAQYQLSTVYRSRGIVYSYQLDRTSAIRDFQTAAEIHRRLSAGDPANKVYRYLRGELLARAGNLLQESGKPSEARTAASEGIGILKTLAQDPHASLSHVFGACRWLMETEVAPLRDPNAAAGFCQEAIKRTKGEDPDGWAGLSAAREKLGDKPGAIEAAEKALALLHPTPPSQPVSVQRQTMEQTLRRFQVRLRVR